MAFQYVCDVRCPPPGLEIWQATVSGFSLFRAPRQGTVYFRAEQRPGQELLPGPCGWSCGPGWCCRWTVWCMRTKSGIWRKYQSQSACGAEHAQCIPDMPHLLHLCQPLVQKPVFLGHGRAMSSGQCWVPMCPSLWAIPDPDQVSLLFVKPWSPVPAPPAQAHQLEHGGGKVEPWLSPSSWPPEEEEPATLGRCSQEQASR